MNSLPIVGLIRVLWRASPAWMSVWSALIVVRSCLPAWIMVGMGGLVSAVEAGDSPVGWFIWFAAGFIASQVSAPILGTAGATLGVRTAEWLQDDLVRTASDVRGIAHLESPSLQADLVRARDFDIGVARPPLYAAVSQLGSGVAPFIGGVISAGLLSVAYRWWAGILLAVAWFASHWLLRRAASWADWRSAESTAHEREAEYAFGVAVGPAQAKEVRLFGLSDWIVARFAAARGRVADLAIARSKLGRVPVLVAIGSVLVANAVVGAGVMADALSGRITVGELTTFLGLMSTTAALGFSEFITWYRMAAGLTPKLTALKARMASAPGVLAPNGTSPPALPVGPDRSTSGRELRLQQVRFGYPASESSGSSEVLRGVDLLVPAGTSLGLVGANGAGKTTMVKLLCRLYDPSAGSILVDGVALPEMDPVRWQSHIAVIFQDYIKYERSLRDNVAPSGAPDALILDCLRRTGAPADLPLDTVLSEAYVGGVDLSGGQWQRVALARALCAVEQGAGLLILDEPTSQLDVRGEAETFDEILSATRGCTTILISHRFPTVRRADSIAVLQDGVVTEQGTHEELLRAEGTYARMFDLQASQYVE